MKHAGIFLGAALACGMAGAANASEIYTFSGKASYQTFVGGNTGGSYSVSFQSADAPQDGGNGYTYVYNLTGTATFTPDNPSASNPIVSGALGSGGTDDVFTLVLRQDPAASAYYVDLFVVGGANPLWSITGDATDVGLLDLTKPGSATPTTNIIDQNFIDFTAGGYGLIQTPKTYLTFSIADAASPAPEPASWAMMIAGFGLISASLRATRRRTSITFA